MNGGALEPSGYPSWGWGNTWTQLDYARKHNSVIPVSMAKVGDHFQYDGHVTWMVGRDSDGKARCWSMGSYPIRILDYDYRDDFISACMLRMP